MLGISVALWIPFMEGDCCSARSWLKTKKRRHQHEVWLRLLRVSVKRGEHTTSRSAQSNIDCIAAHDQPQRGCSATQHGSESREEDQSRLEYQSRVKKENIPGNKRGSSPFSTSCKS